jgi:hypothetical protein
MEHFLVFIVVGAGKQADEGAGRRDGGLLHGPMLRGYGDTDMDTAIRRYNDFPKTRIRGYVSIYIINIAKLLVFAQE